MNIKIIRIITFIKTKFDKSDDQTNHIKINITTNHYYKLLWSSESFEVKYDIGLGIPIENPSHREINLNQSINKKLDFCGPMSHMYNIGFGIPIEISKSKKKKKY